ncbi:MAG: hypothetical protein EBR95_10080 [Verrucomicrobia bacterium]|nr:hypothetical protein [Verrucomicrobiota bacterium]
MSRKILVLPGDGIGPEITAEAVRVLEALNKDGLNLEITTGLLGGCAVDATGEPYPAETRAKAEAADAVLLGAAYCGLCLAGVFWMALNLFRVTLADQMLQKTAAGKDAA